MLGNLLFVRLKSAENALRDGRLDEAYRLATAPDIRAHRRGAAVLAALAERFVERARNHFRADRFTEALMDLDKADAGGVMPAKVAELRQHIQAVAAEHRRREQARRDRLDAARRRIEDGSLVAGRRILEQASDHDAAAGRLRSEIDDRASDAQRIAQQAAELVDQGQFSAAVERIGKARSIDAHSPDVARVESRLCKQVLASVRDALVDGRLRRAAVELHCLGSLGKDLPARREVADMLALAKQATRHLQEGRYAAARRRLLGLQRLLPEAKWIEATAEGLRRIDDLLTEVTAGPLGDRVSDNRINGADEAAPGGAIPRGRPAGEIGEGPINGGGRVHSVVPDETVALARAPQHRAALPGRPAADPGTPPGRMPERLLLLVDGGGSYLVLRGRNASIGRVASEHPADVPIYSDVAERHANIQRVDDDYFLFTSKGVQVSGQPTRHQLLRDGDRIVLGRKAKLTFRLPSRKSPTAVLDLSDTTKMPKDVRRVVLFHRHAIVGADNNAHIRCRHAGTPVVLFERSGSLWMRLRNDGHVDTEPVLLPIGEPVEIAGVSLVLESWQAGPIGGMRA